VLALGRLWVADAGNKRVLECDWDADAGVARIRRVHGPFQEPRGLAESGGSVFVADRLAHTIFRLTDEEAMPVAGTGALAEYRLRAGAALETPLRSPWGLATHGERLAIAMAGSHELWSLDPAAGALRHVAGNGREEIADGRATHAALAQPTGLCVLDGASVAFADCETSAVRVLEDGHVSTVVGTGLFKFGDRPGVGDEALLQHCEDVAYHRGVLAVADTYNDRLKEVDLRTRESVPWPGEAGEEGSLREPGGVFSNGTELLVADTGHHRIVRVGVDGSLDEVRFEG
jgi:hypothetical protein